MCLLPVYQIVQVFVHVYACVYTQAYVIKLAQTFFWRPYPVPQPYCSFPFSGGYVRRRWLKVALLNPIDLWTTISINKTF